MAVDPNGGGMNYRLKLDPHCAGVPFLHSLKRAPVPSYTSIFFCPRHHLPGVRNNHGRPSCLGKVGLFPVVGFSAAIGVTTKKPLSGEGKLLGQTSWTRG